MPAHRFKPIASALFVFSLLALPAIAESRVALSHHTPAYVSRAIDAGPVSPSKTIHLTLWLKMPASAQLDETIAAQRGNKASWLSDEEFASRHAPTSASVASVSRFLRSQGLSIDRVGPDNLYVSASGTTSRVQSAFGVELREFTLQGMSFHANTSNPSLPGSVAALVTSVGGLSSYAPKPMNVRPYSPGHGQYAGAAVSANPQGLFFSAQCFRAPQEQSFSGGGENALYAGNRYGQDQSNSAIGTLAPCGYQPSDLQTAYDMNPLYRAGFDGTGTTVAIVDAFGSTTIANDIATFSGAYGLPAANLTIIGTPTETGFSGTENSGWADETTLDVEWVHAIAPGAKIVLVVTPDETGLFAGVATAAAVPGVAAISNSWAGFESFTDVASRAAFDGVLKAAAAKGIAVNFASGDDGNDAIDLGYADVMYPASSPYATGIGGVSVGLNKNKSINFQTAWGNNITYIADDTGAPFDPPESVGFIFGGGGGVSNVYPQPWFQSGLPGSRRLVPDISWVADPFTGVEIIETEDAAGDQFINVIGGTSLATPMFSGLWGVATQKAGHRLGVATQYLYSLPAGAITDVAPVNSAANVSGVVDGEFQTQWDLALPLQGLPDFYSALYNDSFGFWSVLTFGTDSSLHVRDGFDEATGLGTPDGAKLVNAIARFK